MLLIISSLKHYSSRDRIYTYESTIGGMSPAFNHRNALKKQNEKKSDINEYCLNSEVNLPSNYILPS